jgi:hypothetical protein
MARCTLSFGMIVVTGILTTCSMVDEAIGAQTTAIADRKSVV